MPRAGRNAFALQTPSFDQVAIDGADFTHVPFAGRCAQEALRQRHRHQSRSPAAVTREHAGAALNELRFAQPGSASSNWAGQLPQTACRAPPRQAKPTGRAAARSPIGIPEQDPDQLFREHDPGQPRWHGAPTCCSLAGTGGQTARSSIAPRTGRAPAAGPAGPAATTKRRDPLRQPAGAAASQAGAVQRIPSAAA